MEGHIAEVCSVASNGEVVTILDNANLDIIRFAISGQDLRSIAVFYYELLKPV